MHPHNHISFAVAGSGPVAESHLKKLQINTRVRSIGIFSHNKKRVDQLAREFKIKPYGSMEEMVGDSTVDAVDICNSNYNHFETAKIAIKAGKHVIIEKPVAFKSSQVSELSDLALSQRKVACTVLQKRHNKTVDIVKKIIRSPENILYTQSLLYLPRSSNYYQRKEKSAKEFAGGGVVIYQAIHDLDLLSWMFGEVETILPICTSLYHSIGVEDTCFSLLKFRCGTVSYLHASTIPTLPMTNIHIFFARDMFIVFNNERVGVFPNRYLNKWQKYWRESGRLAQVWSRLSRNIYFKALSHPILESCQKIGRRLTNIRFYGPHAPGSYNDILDDFINEIHNGTYSCITSLSETIEIHGIIEKIYDFEK